MKNYGESLKENRIARGFTLKDIEKNTGINNGNLSRWERGEVLPNIEFCVQMANFYGITLEELLGLEDDFGARTATTPAVMGDNYTADERKIIEQYRSIPEKLKVLVRQQLEIYTAPGELLPKPQKK